MADLDLCRREYVHGTRDYRIAITENNLKTINDALVERGSTFAPITYEDIKEIWEPVRDANERDKQMLQLEDWRGQKYEQSVSEFVREYLEDWIYEWDPDDDLELDGYDPEDWTEEY